MELSFKGKLGRQLANPEAMQKAFGKDRARSLRLRIVVLRNAVSLADVPSEPPDRCHELSGDRAGQFSVRLTANWRLVFEPDPIVSGVVKKEEVTKIRLLAVEDYHGD